MKKIFLAALIVSAGICAKMLHGEGGGYIYTPPSASNFNGTLTVGNGGTGQTTFTTGNILTGAGTAGIQTVSTFTLTSGGFVGINVSAPSTVQLSVSGLNASTTGQIVNGAASATADTLEVQGNGNQVLQVNANSTSVGGTTPPVFTMKPLVVGATAMIVNGAASATADTLEIQGNGNQVLQINANNTSVAGTVPAVMKLTGLTASATMQVINGATGTNADLAQFQVNGSTKAVIGPVGAIGFPMNTKAAIDALTPKHIGEVIQCIDCTNTYALCVATGTAVTQYRRLDSATAGCGTGN